MNEFEDNIVEITLAACCVAAFMQIVVWSVSVSEGGITPGWYIAGWIAFLIALTIWIVNPILQDYIGLVLFVVAFSVPIWGAYQTWLGKN